MNEKLLVNAAPHIRDRETVSVIMKDVLVALIPALIASLYFFGLHALTVILACSFSALVFEALCLKITGKKIAVADMRSALLTGILLAFCLTPITPWWMAAIGSGFAIIFVKHLFGGLGFNVFNPALAARAFLLASWPVLMTTWVRPFDAVTSATPLAKPIPPLTSLIDLFTGNVGGSLGETSAIALLIGAAYLIYRNAIDLRIPAAYLGTVILFTLIFTPSGVEGALFHLFAGGLMLGAFYMATDPVTSPTTKMGRWIFGFGCGALTLIIRLWGGYPEGVCYAILLMNAATPLLDKYTRGKVFGEK